jgi:hypothetical protein
LKRSVAGEELGEGANPPAMLAHDGDDFGGDLVEDVEGFICAREIGEVCVR